MTDYIVNYPLNYLFKHITNENGGTLIRNPISLSIKFNDIFVINNIVFIKNNQTDKLVYESKDKSITIEVNYDKMQLYYTIYTFSNNYMDACRRKYKKENLLNIRVDKLNKEITRIQDLKILIKTVIIFNLNLKKSRNDSHHVKIKEKLEKSGKYNKPIFLYELDELVPDVRNRIITYINTYIIADFISINDKLEKFYIGISICKILKNIDLYINYLNECITNINLDLFNLNKNLMVNDVLTNRIIENNDIRFTKMYNIIDHNVYGIDLYNKSIPSGYCLSLSTDKNKWNVYPLNNDKSNYTISDNDIQNLINIAKLYNDENICLLEKYVIL